MRTDNVITSFAYAANAVSTQVAVECPKAASQACFHYSSAIRVNPQWATLTCPPEAASTAWRLKDSGGGGATKVWSDQHKGEGWLDENNRPHGPCDRDEYLPAYLLKAQTPAWQNSGKNGQGQLVRYTPRLENSKAGQMWKGACFTGPIKALSNSNLENAVKADPKPQIVKTQHASRMRGSVIEASTTLNERPEFTIDSWRHSANPPRTTA